MLEIVQALHAAFHTDSRWLFVVYIGILGFVGAAGLAYVVDSGYQRAVRERLDFPPTPVVVRDTAEEDRLRNQVQDLISKLHTQTEKDASKKKREEIRTQLGNLLTSGRQVMNDCFSKQQTPGFSCEKTANDWFHSAADYIQKNLEPSYYSRFVNASGNSLSYTGVSPAINPTMNSVNYKCEALEQFIMELLN